MLSIVDSQQRLAAKVGQKLDLRIAFLPTLIRRQPRRHPLHLLHLPHRRRKRKRGEKMGQLQRRGTLPRLDQRADGGAT
jgi:hypothetical protein